MDRAKVQLIGRLGQDPEFKTSASGIEILKFSIATNRGKKNEEVTDWHNCIAFGKLAALCKESIFKGSRVIVDGDLQKRKYEKDGVNHTITEVIARDVIYLDKRGEQTTVPRKESAPVFNKKPEFKRPAYERPTITTEDIPF